MIRMASSEMRDTDRATAGEAPPTAVGETKQAEGSTAKGGPVPRHAGRFIAAAERDRMLKEARNVEFPVGVRGYQRTAVDRYVERVNRLITELEMYSSPESAVKHALDEVSDETRDILQHAHHSAEEITVRARAKADEQLQQADRDAADTLGSAEQQARETREAAATAAQDARDAAEREAQELRDGASQEAEKLRDLSQREVGQLRETAEREITELRETTSREIDHLRVTAQRESEQLLENARREAGETLEAAQNRAEDLARSAELIWRERKRLIEDVHAVGEQLVTLGDAEAKRFAALPNDLPLGDRDVARGHPSATNGESAEAPQEPATLG